jgi:hypothetical protein
MGFFKGIIGLLLASGFAGLAWTELLYPGRSRISESMQIAMGAHHILIVASMLLLFYVHHLGKKFDKSESVSRSKICKYFLIAGVLRLAAMMVIPSFGGLSDEPSQFLMMYSVIGGIPVLCLVLVGWLYILKSDAF